MALAVSDLSASNAPSPGMMMAGAIGMNIVPKEHLVIDLSV